MGWCIVIALPATIECMTIIGFLWLLAGGISFTVGALLYVVGKHKNIPFMHSVFHLFVVLGAGLQYVAVLGFVIL